MQPINEDSMTHKDNTSDWQAMGPFSSGAILLSANRDLLYSTPEGHRLLLHLAESEGQSDSSLDLPSCLLDLCDEIEADYHRCVSQDRRVPVHSCRMTATVNYSIKLRGHLLPEWTAPAATKLLIIIEALHVSELKRPGQSAPHIPFTVRQEAVAKGLVRGLTNKELATELSLSAHTVKEYVRIIMSKLHASTRTGAVARLANIFPQQSISSLEQRTQDYSHQPYR